MATFRHRGHYGTDAPYAPLGMVAGAMACAGVAIFGPVPQLWISVAVLLALPAVYLHTTWRGKFRVWQALLDDMAWRGDEAVLDLGCGRGMVLLMAAGHVPRGRATGVDIWSVRDQAGNAMAATLENARCEGVAERVELHTADMCRLPFEDAGFDVVVSNVAIHNIRTRAAREQAIDEAWRVLRPGGRLLIADISRSNEYRQRLQALGATPACRNLGWRMWWGGPWVPTILVDVRKEAAAWACRGDGVGGTAETASRSSAPGLAPRGVPERVVPACAAGDFRKPGAPASRGASPSAMTP